VTDSAKANQQGVVTTHPKWWTDLDTNAVDTARLLAADAVQKVGNGHPGTAMSLAPLAYLLYQRVMRHDPTDPNWIGRDRFMLSNGHASLTQYCQLFLSGYGLELADLEALRTWGSLTPGHPEHGHTAGVEVTTGPLGQGIGNAVGMAMAARRERGLLDPDAAAGESPFDHHIYVFAGDGCMEEGISSEASSLAGHQQLGNLIMFYDDNHISIEDDTAIAFSEDVLKRYDAYGWHTQRVDSGEDVVALEAAIKKAQRVTDRPSIIAVRTIIGWPAPTKQNTGAAHGSALGEDEIRKTKKILGFDPDVHFAVDAEVLAHARDVVARGRAAHAEWQQRFEDWAAGNASGAALLERMIRRELPAGWAGNLPSFPTEKDGKANAVSTRAASGKVLSALAVIVPELWGGSADLAESNNTTMDGEPSFTPAEFQTKMWPGGPYGRTLHFGIREHAMGSIMNGITLHGGTRVYGGTFLVFSDYMRPPVRLAALMKLPTIYVWTHDSIGLGGDGPTHQADRAPRRTAGHPGPGHRPSRGRERDRGVLAGDVGAHRPADRARAVAAEPAGAGSGEGRRRGQGRLRPRGGVVGAAAADHHRDRLRGVAGAHRPRAARGRGHAHAGGVDAVLRVVRRADAGVPPAGAAARHQGTRQRRGGRPPGLARDRRRLWRDHQHRAFRRERRGQRDLRAVRFHP